MNETKVVRAKRTLLYQLEQGRTLTRESMIEATAMDDRTNRAAIEMLRKEGQPIVTVAIPESRKEGYRFAKNQKELNEFLRFYRSYAFRILKTANLMQKHDPNQMDIWEWQRELEEVSV